MADIFDDNKSQAEKIVEQLKNMGRMTKEQMRRSVIQGAMLVWKNRSATPAEILAAMGTNAVAFFDKHAETVAFLVPNDPALMPELSKIIGKYTKNEDGTITVEV